MDTHTPELTLDTHTPELTVDTHTPKLTVDAHTPELTVDTYISESIMAAPSLRPSVNLSNTRLWVFKKITFSGIEISY